MYNSRVLCGSTVQFAVSLWCKCPTWYVYLVMKESLHSSYCSHARSEIQLGQFPFSNKPLHFYTDWKFFIFNFRILFPGWISYCLMYQSDEWDDLLWMNLIQGFFMRWPEARCLTTSSSLSTGQSILAKMGHYYYSNQFPQLSRWEITFNLFV